jgi:hypothetical protein
MTTRVDAVQKSQNDQRDVISVRGNVVRLVSGAMSGSTEVEKSRVEIYNNSTADNNTGDIVITLVSQ